jgi:hypothetical protein
MRSLLSIATAVHCQRRGIKRVTAVHDVGNIATLADSDDSSGCDSHLRVIHFGSTGCTETLSLTTSPFSLTSTCRKRDTGVSSSG